MVGTHGDFITDLIPHDLQELTQARDPLISYLYCRKGMLGKIVLPVLILIGVSTYRPGH